tara:strand:- start:845 stop:1165 length:321 start_codon:yes stop_codon:yes gene_type:complete
MDELKPIEVADAGGLPDAVRARVRRRRVVHRARVGGGVVCVLLVAVVGVLMVQVDDETTRGAWEHNAVISLDDPMFDALDEGYRNNRVDSRWRAGARLDGDWVLEM